MVTEEIKALEQLNEIVLEINDISEELNDDLFDLTIKLNVLKEIMDLYPSEHYEEQLEHPTTFVNEINELFGTIRKEYFALTTLRDSIIDELNGNMAEIKKVLIKIELITSGNLKVSNIELDRMWKKLVDYPLACNTLIDKVWIALKKPVASKKHEKTR